MVLKAIPNINYLDKNSFVLFAGPCVVEGEEITYEIASYIKEITDELKIPFVFKASYRKANRTKLDSFRGIGDEDALVILRYIREDLEIPIITDIHNTDETFLVAQYVDILQIPAFLCRQTELLVAAAKTGNVINIKKGPFLSPQSMKYAIEKIIETGNPNVMVTERGTMFGYQDMVVDFRSITEMKKFKVPVILDITHSNQQPNQSSGVSGGRTDMIETIARAGIAVGVDGIFLETHPDPEKAKSDGENMLKMDLLKDLLVKLSTIRNAVNSIE